MGGLTFRLCRKTSRRGRRWWALVDRAGNVVARVERPTSARAMVELANRLPRQTLTPARRAVQLCLLP